MGKLENGRKVAAWKCPFPATLSKPFFKALPSIRSFFRDVNVVALITQFLWTTEPTEYFFPQRRSSPQHKWKQPPFASLSQENKNKKDGRTCHLGQMGVSDNKLQIRNGHILICRATNRCQVFNHPNCFP